MHDSWARGQIPVWYPSVSGGRPLLPNPNAGVFYPVRVGAFARSVSGGHAPVSRSSTGSSGAGGCSCCCARSAARVLPPGSPRSATPSRESSSPRCSSETSIRARAFSLESLGARATSGAADLADPADRSGVRAHAAGGRRLLAGTRAACGLSLDPVRDARAGSDLARRPLGRRPRGRTPSGAAPGSRDGAARAGDPPSRSARLALGDVTAYTIPWARLFELVVPFPFGPSWSMDRSLDWGDAAFRRFFISFFVGPIALVGLFASVSGGACPRSALCALARVADGGAGALRPLPAQVLGGRCVADPASVSGEVHAGRDARSRRRRRPGRRCAARAAGSGASGS